MRILYGLFFFFFFLSQASTLQIHYVKSSYLLFCDMAVNSVLIRLTLCKILGSHSRVSEDSSLKGCDTISFGEWFPLLGTILF